MKFSIEQPALRKALSRAVSVTPGRTTIPILSNVLIDALTDAERGLVWIVATDLDMEARVSAVAQIDAPGQITVPAKRLADIAAAAPGGAQIAVAYDQAQDPRVAVGFGRSRYNLPALPAGDYPVWGQKDWPDRLTLDAVDLAQMIDRAAFAATTDATRTYLHGGFFHRVAIDGAPWLRLTATDGHRLAWAQIRDGQTAGAGPVAWSGVILPSKTLAEFRRALDGRAGDVALALSTSGVRLELGDMAVSSKVLDGAYVDYNRVVPQDWARQIIVDRDLLIAAIGRVALMATHPAAPMKVAIDEAGLRLSLRADDAGQAVEEVEAEVTGDPFETGFNARYLIEALRQTGADRVRLGMEDMASPLRIEPVEDDAEHGAALSIVMPHRV